MRLTRIVAAVLAVALALSLAISLVAAVDAAPRKPRHSLEVSAKEIGSSDRFVLFGKVSAYPKDTIIVTRSVASGPYRQLKKIETSKSGRFRTRIFQVPRRLTCFKVIVPETADHRRTTSKGSSCIKS